MKYQDLGIFGIVVGVIGAAYSIYQTKKSNDIAKKLDISLSDLEKKTPVELDSAFMAKATKNAIDREVAAYAKRVSEDIRSDMDSMIRKDVDRCYSELKESVTERASEEVASIDYDEMRKDIRRKAEKKVFEEFCGITGLGRIFGDMKNGRNVSLSEVSDILDQFTFSSDKQRALDTLLGNRRN